MALPLSRQTSSFSKVAVATLKSTSTSKSSAQAVGSPVMGTPAAPDAGQRTCIGTEVLGVRAFERGPQGQAVAARYARNEHPSHASTGTGNRDRDHQASPSKKLLTESNQLDSFGEWRVPLVSKLSLNSRKSSFCLSESRTGRLDHHSAKQVAGRSSAHGRRSAAAQPELFAGLGLRRHAELHPAVQGRHVDLAAEHGVGELKRHFAVEGWRLRGRRWGGELSPLGHRDRRAAHGPRPPRLRRKAGCGPPYRRRAAP